MKVKASSLLLFTSAVLWLFIGENALVGLFVSIEIKLFVVVCIILSLFILVIIKMKDWFRSSHYLYVFALFIAFISILLRVYFVDDESAMSISKTAFKFLSVMLILIAIERIFLSIQPVNNKLVIPPFLSLILIATFISFILYIVSPMILYTFIDHAGHEVKVIYGSMSSSVYRIGAANFARLNFVFDEPGTFGVFISFLVSFIYYMQKRITFSLIIVISAGVVSVSLAYFLFLFLFFIYILSKKMMLKFNFKTLFWIFFAFSIVLVASNLRDEVQIFNYVFERFNSVLSNEHNRSDGNSEALKSILNAPEGTAVRGFDERRFTSSGLFIIAAYHGILYAFSFILLYAGFMLSIIKKGGSWFPLLIALSLTLISRNNLFNYSGPAIMIFAVYICYISNNSKKNAYTY